MSATTKRSATLELYMVDEEANRWTWQIETEGTAITPQRGRTFQTARSARKAARIAADKLGVHITKESNLEER